MEVIGKLKVTRFAQTEPGDLLMYTARDGLFPAMTVTDPTNDGDRLVVIIGADFPQGMKYPSLMTPSATTVISFGKDYTLRLPSRVKGWVTAEPPDNVNCLVLADDGRLFLRANYGPLEEFRPCYIDMDSGEIQTDRDARRYVVPAGIRAFAVEWDLLTIEKEPRSILSNGNKKGG